MGTVATLLRPPGDPFHERLVAAYPQIRRFLPRSIEAVELQAIDSAAPVLAAYHAIGKWLIDKPTSPPSTPPATRATSAGNTAPRCTRGWPTPHRIRPEPDSRHP